MTYNVFGGTLNLAQSQSPSNLRTGGYKIDPAEKEAVKFVRLSIAVPRFAFARLC